MYTISALTEGTVRNLVLNWYNATNEHLPVEELELMLAADVRMTYPNLPELIVGIPAFRSWYAGVLALYFDETHVVEKWEISLDSATTTATAFVVVRWETRSWTPNARTSTYGAYLSKQKFVITQRQSDGAIVIAEKHVLTFEPTAAVYGPFLNPQHNNDPFLHASTAIQAARNGDTQLLATWLLQGGNPNQYDADGWTPLLAGSASGHAAVVSLLLSGLRGIKSDPEMRFLKSGALPIHLAGQSGSCGTAAEILKVSPLHLNSVWELNGHTLLLQAAFYGHLELASFALAAGANTAITTARGLSALDLARL